MRALLDVNVLIALLDQAHPHHASASSWLKAHVRDGWASCPITQNGCVRIMSQPAYPGARSPAVVGTRLREAVMHAAHEFWPDEVALLDERAIDMTRIHGARQTTDAYLLALAVRRGGRLVTFDAAISLAVAKGASAQHIVVLA